jgi:hypothetical protein
MNVVFAYYCYEVDFCFFLLAVRKESTTTNQKKKQIHRRVIVLKSSKNQRCRICRKNEKFPQALKLFRKTSPAKKNKK